MMSANGTLEIDSGELYDTDSLLSTDASSRYAPASLQDYDFENGRRYHTYRNGSYLFPNDEKEQDRLELVHYIMKKLIGDRLQRAVFTYPPRHVLDIGTGTGSWAIDFADANPDSQVVGIDLSQIQPSNIPPNCRFFVDDIEAPWTFDSKFDFIHARTMAGAIKNWDSLLQQAYDNLNEGGVIEFQECEVFFKSDDDSMKRLKAIPVWQEHLNNASEMVGQKLNIVETMPQRLERQGFTGIRDDIYKLPIGPWPKDRRLKELGYVTLFQAFEALESWTLAPFTRVLGWPKEDMRDLMDRVKGELTSARNHMYVCIHYTYGRKPASGF